MRTFASRAVLGTSLALAAAGAAAAVPAGGAAFDLHDRAGIALELLAEGAATVRSLPGSWTSRHGCAVALGNKLEVVSRHVDQSRLDEALDKLDNDVIPDFAPDAGSPGREPCVVEPATQVSLQETIGLARDLLAGLRGNARTVTVSPGGGGRLALDDGTVLTFEPGAVDRPTQITARSGRSGSLAEGGLVWVDLAPDGLRLAVPARLSIPFSPDPGLDPEQVEVEVFSGLNPAVATDGEIALFQPATVLDVDVQGGRVDVAVEHFSTVMVAAARDVFVAADLPPRFLSAGDMLFVLSGGRWFPAHAGLYTAALKVDAQLPEGLAVESAPTVPDAGCAFTLGGLPISFGRGVFENPLSGSFVGPARIYMGARRPAATALAAGQRDAVVRFARSQVGDCYLPVGSVQGNDDYWSCTELVVGSYLAAGVREMLPLASQPFILPYQLYSFTRPVDHLTLGVGERIDVPVRVASRSGGRFAPYAENPPGTTLTASGSDVASLGAAARVLTLEPQSRHACSTQPVVLTGGGPSGATDSLTLQVKVNDFQLGQPRPAGVILNRLPEVGVRVASACGVPLVWAELRLDGQPVDRYDDPAAGSSVADLRFQPAAQLTLGGHTVEVRAEDREGARHSSSWSFRVDPVYRTLSVTAAGTGSGTVVSSPAGLSCPGNCAAQFVEGTLVTLAAVPSAGSIFKEWLGDCSGTSASTTVAMTAGKSCQAVFEATCTPAPAIWTTRIWCNRFRRTFNGSYSTDLGVFGKAQGCPGTTLHVTLRIVFEDGTIQERDFGEGGCPSIYLGNTGECNWAAGSIYGKPAASLSVRATASRGNTVVETTPSAVCQNIN